MIFIILQNHVESTKETEFHLSYSLRHNRVACAHAENVLSHLCLLLVFESSHTRSSALCLHPPIYFTTSPLVLTVRCFLFVGYGQKLMRDGTLQKSAQNCTFFFYCLIGWVENLSCGGDDKKKDHRGKTSACLFECLELRDFNNCNYHSLNSRPGGKLEQHLKFCCRGTIFKNTQHLLWVLIINGSAGCSGLIRPVSEPGH